MDYDGCSDGRNIAGLLRACMAFGKMVPEAGGRARIEIQEAKYMILLGIIVLLLGGYLVYALTHPEKF